MATKFDDLPLEAKELLLSQVEDYEPISRVSKEWRHLVKSSKKIMQKELDKYYFVFVIWCWDESEVDRDCFSGRVHSRFIFPIATEEQFIFLNSKAPLTQRAFQTAIGALQNDLKFFFINDGYGDVAFYFRDKLTQEERNIEQEENISIASTETLIEKLKNGANTIITIRDYLRERFKGPHVLSPYYFDDDTKYTKLIRGLKFSDKKLMVQLLKQEHTLCADYERRRLYLIHPYEYDRLENFPYTADTKSLFAPHWTNFIELRTKRDFGDLDIV